MQYYVLQYSADPQYCVITDLPKGLPHSHYAVDGISLAKTKYDYVFDMAASRPGIVVADAIKNTLGYTLVSARMKELLAKHATAEIEFTPCKLKNHKKRFVTEELFIANVLGTLDCVDRAKTVGREDPVNPGRYMSITQLAFDDRINPAVNLFRLAVRPKYLIFREDLKAIVEAGALTGLVFSRVGDKVRL